MTCRVAVFNNHGRYRVPGQKTRDYAIRVLRLAGIRKAEIRIVFVDSQYCRKINKKFLGHDEVTDVISFPLEAKPNLEGEVYVNIDSARRQARDFRVSIANEVARLVIHGVLHLVGYDDTTRGKAAVMKKREDAHVRYWFPGKG
ncbi:MAG: rRNA maturation factor [Bacteroidetes bacterium]|nr:rRNA maturation factor [Bacteroidota bacterium]